MTTLTVSIVTFHTDASELAANLRALMASADAAHAAGLLTRLNLTLVDNGPPGSGRDRLSAVLADPQLQREYSQHQLLAAPGNLGYGAANNLAIKQCRDDLCLIMNPDVTVAPDALAAALRFMHQHPEVVLLCPRANDRQGKRQYLAKRQPAVLTLLARALPLPNWLRDRAGNARYEMRAEQDAGMAFQGDFLATGCFLLCRQAALATVGGFDSAYFMYFEDFDLSRRLAKVGALSYCPEVNIVHGGGRAARKGLRHIVWFTTSGLRYFQRHGWHWVS